MRRGMLPRRHLTTTAAEILGRQACPLVAATAVGARARRALVLLDVLRLGRRDLDALAMEPPLAHVTADPELIRAIIVPTSSAKRLPVLVTTTGNGATILASIWGFILAVFLLRLRLGLLCPRLRCFLHFIAGLGFAIAVIIIARCLCFTLPTNNIKNSGKIINHTKQALPVIFIKSKSSTKVKCNRK